MRRASGRWRNETVRRKGRSCPDAPGDTLTVTSSNACPSCAPGSSQRKASASNEGRRVHLMRFFVLMRGAMTPPPRMLEPVT